MLPVLKVLQLEMFLGLGLLLDVMLLMMLLMMVLLVMAVDDAEFLGGY